MVHLAVLLLGLSSKSLVALSAVMADVSGAGQFLVVHLVALLLSLNSKPLIAYLHQRPKQLELGSHRVVRPLTPRIKVNLSDVFKCPEVGPPKIPSSMETHVLQYINELYLLSLYHRPMYYLPPHASSNTLLLPQLWPPKN